MFGPTLILRLVAAPLEKTVAVCEIGIEMQAIYENFPENVKGYPNTLLPQKWWNMLWQRQQ